MAANAAASHEVPAIVDELAVRRWRREEIYEAARRNKDGSFVDREAVTKADYDANGIDSELKAVKEIGMRQLDFFGVWTDSWRVTNDILRQSRLRVIPDVWYDHANAKVFDVFSEELKSILMVKRQFFIISRDAPMQDTGFVVQRQGPKAGKYRIDISLLSPGVICTLPACIQEGGLTKLSSGSVFLPEEFLTENETRLDTSDTAEEIYAASVECVTRNCVKQRIVNCSGWIGRDAALLLNSGRANVKDRGV